MPPVFVVPKCNLIEFYYHIKTVQILCKDSEAELFVASDVPLYNF